MKVPARLNSIPGLKSQMYFRKHNMIFQLNAAIINLKHFPWWSFKIELALFKNVAPFNLLRYIYLSRLPILGEINMNIRKVDKETEIEKLVEIWYTGSLIAHDFIDKDFWKSQRKEMKEKYLPMAETYVISDEKEIVGFISMVNSYLAALFIDHKHHGKGYGKRLLNFIKEQRANIQLKVYSDNDKAVHFYLKNGFKKIEELLDDQTGEQEFLMEWTKDPSLLQQNKSV